MRLAAIFAIALTLSVPLLGGCGQHRLIVPQPNPTGAPIIVNSDSFAFGTVQRRTVVKCDTNIMDEVRVHQNIGQALITVLTLGIYMPTTIEYVCGNVPNAEGNTDN